MEDEPAKPESNYPLASSTAKMSKTPSWVMLGFVLGALFVYAMMRQAQTAEPAAGSFQIVEAPRPLEPSEAMPLATIEAVFEVWGEHAVWFDGSTEVALWSSKERAFSEFYEIRRIGGTNYFRSIPKLTRRALTHGKEMPDSPLQFTETEEQYREWREHGRTERRVERDLRPGRSPPPSTTPLQVVPPGAILPPPLPDPAIGLAPSGKK